MDINSVVTQNRKFTAQVFSGGEHFGARVLIMLSRRRLESKDALTLHRRVFIKLHDAQPLFLCPHHSPCHRPGKRLRAVMKYRVMHVASNTADSNRCFHYIAKEKSMCSTYKNCQINAKTPWHQSFFSLNFLIFAMLCTSAWGINVDGIFFYSGVNCLHAI